MNNNESWNTVDWDDVPEDVEAVVCFSHDEPTYYQLTGGNLYEEPWRGGCWYLATHLDYGEILNRYGDRFHLRPIVTPEPIKDREPQPNTTWEAVWDGLFCGNKPTPEPSESTQVESSQVKGMSVPSIQSILSDAQELIKKHHNITGEVKFTIKCS